MLATKVKTIGFLILVIPFEKYINGQFVKKTPSTRYDNGEYSKKSCRQLIAS